MIDVIKTCSQSTTCCIFVQTCCQIFTDLYKVNTRTLLLLVIFQNEHSLDWSSFVLLDYPGVFFYLEKSQIWSSGFWETFICSLLNHHCIALHYIFWSYKNRYIIGDIEWQLITEFFYLLYCYKDFIINIHYQHNNIKNITSLTMQTCIKISSYFLAI